MYYDDMVKNITVTIKSISDKPSNGTIKPETCKWLSERLRGFCYIISEYAMNMMLVSFRDEPAPAEFVSLYEEICEQLHQGLAS